MDVASTAISIVSLCAEFSKFAKKAYDVGQEIHHSATGATKDHAQMERLLQESIDLNQKLILSNRHDVQKVPDEGLKELLAALVKESGNLLDALRKLKKKPSDNTKRDNLRILLANFFQEDKIVKAKSKVDNLQSQLATRLIVIEHMEKQKVDDCLPVDNNDDVVEEHHVPAKRSRHETGIESIRELLATLPQRDPEDKDIKQLTKQLLKLHSSFRDEEIGKKIIDQLWYTHYRSRIYKIEGDEDTKFHSHCQWVYDSKAFHSSSNDDFSTWLRDGSGVYWITGKPGSGKSILMHFLIENPQTVSELKVWAKDATIITASFFFWYRGPEIERGRAGLLKSLFYEIVKANPAFARKLFPERWKALRSRASFEDNISDTELGTAVTNLVNLKDQDYKFCFFIDGLDEFAHGHTDSDESTSGRADILECIRRMTDGGRVKICVSSRPWGVFIEEYQQDSSLRVHELTRDNMKNYINGRLASVPRWIELTDRHPTATTKLVEQIVDKAQGVFLWVRYVTAKLKLKINEVLNVKQLESEVDKFPVDLHTFFGDMLRRLDLDEDFRAQSRKIFLTALSSPEPLLGLVYSFLSQGTSKYKGQYSWARENKRLHEKDLRLRANTVSYWIGGRCQDLLEVYIENGDQRVMATTLSRWSRPAHTGISREEDFVEYITKVDFLHRTGRDYLETEEGQALIKTDTSFDPLDYILQASLTLLRCQSSGTRKINRTDALRSIMHPVLSIISNLAAVDKEPTIGFLNDLDDAGFQCVNYHGRKSTKCWTETFHESCRDFLCLAVVLNLKNYVKSRFDDKNECSSNESKEDLLSLALDFSPFGKRLSLPHYEMIQTILDLGAKPNDSHSRAWSRLKRNGKSDKENTPDLEQKIENVLVLAGYRSEESKSESESEFSDDSR